MTRAAPSRGLAARLIRRLPEKVATAPERALVVNLGCALIGLSALIEPAGGPLHSLWPFAQYEWGAAMLLGGMAAFYGMRRHQRSTERLGVLLLLLGSLFFAVVLLAEYHFAGVITALIFLLISVATAIRLILTSAIRSQVIRLSEEMKEDSEQSEGGPL